MNFDSDGVWGDSLDIGAVKHSTFVFVYGYDDSVAKILL